MSISLMHTLIYLILRAARRDASRRTHGAVARVGTSGNLHPLAVLPVEMSLLRLQQPCRERIDADAGPMRC